MPQDSKTRTQDLLRLLEAQVESLRGQKDAALDKLAGRTDPASVRRRIGIRIDVGQLEKVAQDIDGLDLSDGWIELAVFAIAGTGDLARAKSFVAWASTRSNPSLLNRTCVLFVDGCMKWAFRARGENASIVPGSLDIKEGAIISEVITIISPFCDVIIAKQKIETEVESQLLQRYFDLAYLAGDRAMTTRLFEVLLNRAPIPIKLGQAIIQRVVKPTIEVANRLWDEHPDSFRAQLLSTVIVARDFNDVAKAEARAWGLALKAKTQHEREELIEFIYELSDSGKKDFPKLEKLAIELLGEDAPLLSIIRADRLVHADKHADALELLESNRDDADPRWLRVYANAKLKAGEAIEALDLLKRLGAIVPHPEILGAIINLSEEQGRVEDQRQALEKAIAFDPANLSARWRLAMLCVKATEYAEAAKQFEVLREVNPDDEAVLVNLAVSYSFSGQTEKALAMLIPKGGQSILPLSLLHVRAQVLEAMGRVDDAFLELTRARALYWDKPQFLVAYMTLGYASGNEKEANAAIAKLQELRQQGVVDDQLMRPASMNEMRDWIQQAAKQHDELRRLLLQGKLPWITGAQLQREVPLWSWLLKTQPLDWVWDETLNRATYTVYATNSYRVYQQAPFPSTLEEITAPDRGTAVVVDLTALMTLHALGLISSVAEYFGTLYVPTAYLARVVDDAVKLLPHQRSRKQAAADIAAAMSANRIKILDVGVGNTLEYPRLDEYADEGQGGREPIRLRQLLKLLHGEGLIDDQQLSEASPVAHKEGRGDQNALRTGSRLLVGELTLETIHGVGLFGTLTREFSVYLSKSDADEISARLRAFDALEETRAKYQTLWETLRNDKRVQFVASPHQKVDRKDKPDAWDLALVAMYLAKEKASPLLCDDRVIQAVTSNEQKQNRTAAFGTDTAVKKLFEDGLLDAVSAAKALLQLMEWRYRFIVMPPELMTALAEQHKSHPPGHALRQVAKYIHDCMRDPGLFSGLELTSPPVSIAVRLYQTWAQNIAEFIMDAWIRSDLADPYIEQLSDWALSECLPSPPRGLDDRMQATIAALTPLTVFTRALIRGSGSTNFEKVNRGLRVIAKKLDIDEKDYVSYVIKLVGGGDE